MWSVECAVGKAWSVAGGGDLVVLVSCLFVNYCSGAFAETLWAHDACKNKLVFLLQRFALVVQEREYIRVRGFHLVLEILWGSSGKGELFWL